MNEKSQLTLLLQGTRKKPRPLKSGVAYKMDIFERIHNLD
jgi:hypothetical protein